MNVNRIRQFRLSYITAADGQHKNHEVVFGREFIIRCAWPEDYGPEVLRRTLWASVTKVTNIEANPPDVDRTAHSGILPE